jgi:hypothetical protein
METCAGNEDGTERGRDHSAVNHCGRASSRFADRTEEIWALTRGGLIGVRQPFRPAADLPIRERQQLLKVAFPHCSDCMRAVAASLWTQWDNDSTPLHDAFDLMLEDV